MALNNAQYESIIRDYEHIRDANRHTLESRKAEVYQTIPEYRELEDSISTLSVSAAKAMLAGDDSARDRLHDSLLHIRQSQQALLTSAGLPADYLKPVYRCPACEDTGYITDENNLKQKCSCFRQREISILYSQSNIQDMISRENFSTLSTEYYKGEDLRRFETAVDLCWNFIKNFN